jgi:hypothetical protein
MLGAVLVAFGVVAVPSALAAPAPAPAAEPTAFHEAAIVPVSEPTPAPELVRRGLGDDIASYIDSLASDVGSGVSSFVNSGILDFPTGFPTGSAVEKSLSISSSDLEALPTQVMNIP